MVPTLACLQSMHNTSYLFFSQHNPNGLAMQNFRSLNKTAESHVLVSPLHFHQKTTPSQLKTTADKVLSTYIDSMDESKSKETQEGDTGEDMKEEESAAPSVQAAEGFGENGLDEFFNVAVPVADYSGIR